ncbi:hypothetical protein D1007_04331 [Hordeum vulgare]|nr:hypothetical protein D1007_04331 [Hordeum vulgare]
MEWDQMRAEKRLEIEREKIELEKEDAVIKWELEKAKPFGVIELEKERLQFARGTEDAKIMLVDGTHLDAHAKKWVAEKKEINDRRAHEAATTAATVEDATRMQAKHDKLDE